MTLREAALAEQQRRQQAAGAASPEVEAARAELARRQNADRRRQTTPIADLPPRTGVVDSLRDNFIGVDNGVMSTGEKIATALNMGGESLTAGLVGDEAAAGFDAFVGRGSYEDRLNLHRSNEEQLWQENPVIAGTATIGPALALPSAAALRAGSLVARAGKSALVGGTTGGLFGFMEGEGDSRVTDAQFSGGLGAGIGAAIPVLGAGISRVLGRMSERSAIRDAIGNERGVEALRARASQLFAQADASAPMSRAAFGEAAADIADNATRMGADDILTPSAARAVDRATAAAADDAAGIGFRELDILRRQAGVAAEDMSNRTQSAIGTQTARAIDDFIDEANPTVGGMVGEARSLWGRLRRSEQMDAAFQRAGDAASGFQNGIMNEFRSILKSPAKSRGFGDDELAAMRAVTNPGVGQALLRQVGKMGFSLDGGNAGMGAMISGLGGTAASGGNALVGLGLTGLGTAARAASAKMTQRSAERAQDIVSLGGLPPAQAVQSGLRAAGIDLSRAGAVRGTTIGSDGEQGATGMAQAVPALRSAGYSRTEILNIISGGPDAIERALTR